MQIIVRHPISRFVICMLIALSGCYNAPPAPTSVPLQTDITAKKLKWCVEGAKQIELVVLTDSYSDKFSRIGPIVVNDAQKVAQFRAALSSLSLGMVNPHPHERLTSQGEVLITIVYGDVDHVRCRLTGGALMFFDDEYYLDDGNGAEAISQWVNARVREYRHDER